MSAPLQTIPAPPRADIQALRAIAVMAVVLYHLWPSRVTGGYVGVDIFFVISGFLIIGHLLREADAGKGISLSRFWARRVRRLLPASLLVLAVSGVATAIWAPVVWWQQFFEEIAAAALYVLNWLLAANAVDYLAADNTASPAQHFWSLSVEEQFYIAWPIMIVIIMIVTRQRSARTKSFAVGAALIAVTVASFAASEVGVLVDPGNGYFSTLGRAWEFGIGGILAFAGARLSFGSVAVRAVASWLGLAMIAATLVLYTPATEFPGFAAALPVGGTLLVIWAGTPAARLAPTRVLSLRPVQWLGNVSYSLYLWHWPPIILLPFVLDRELSTRDRLVLLVAVAALAWLTKKFVEDPIRSSRVLLARPARLSFAALFAVTALVVVGVGAGYVNAGDRVKATALAVERVLSGPGTCIGALATIESNHCEDPYAVTVLTDPAFAASDIGKGVEEKDACKQTLDGAEVIACEFGDVTSPVTTMALVGDSHAGHLVEALDLYGAAHGIRFITYLKTYCVGTGANDVAAFTLGGMQSCTDWGKSVTADIIGDPSIETVIYSNFTAAYLHAASSSKYDMMASDFTSPWEQLLDSGRKVITVRDIPSERPVDIPGCVALHLDVYDPCTMSLAASLLAPDENPVLEAASALDVPVVDLTDVFCDGDTCHTVIGGFIVYFGGHHMTATFSRTIAPILGDAIVKATTSP